MSRDFGEKEVNSQFLGALEEYMTEGLAEISTEINRFIQKDYEVKKEKSDWEGLKKIKLKKPIAVKEEKKEEQKEDNKKTHKDKTTKTTKTPKESKGKKKESKNKKDDNDQQINQSKKK